MKIKKLNIRSYSLIMILIILSYFNSSCQHKIKKTIIEADLTFKSVSFNSVYGASDKQYDILKHEIDSVIKSGEENETKKLYKYFDRLNQHGLLKSPYIFLRIKEDSVLPVYLSEKEYDKVKDIKHVDLVKKNKKAIVKLELSKIDDEIYYSDNIIEVKKVKGKSRSNLVHNN